MSSDIASNCFACCAASPAAPEAPSSLPLSPSSSVSYCLSAMRAASVSRWYLLNIVWSIFPSDSACVSAAFALSSSFSFSRVASTSCETKPNFCPSSTTFSGSSLSDLFSSASCPRTEVISLSAVFSTAAALLIELFSPDTSAPTLTIYPYLLAIFFRAYFPQFSVKILSMSRLNSARISCSVSKMCFLGLA